MVNVLFIALGVLVAVVGIGHLVWEARDLRRETEWVTDPRNPLPYDRRVARRRRNRRA